MAAISKTDLETPSSTAIAAARQTDHRILMDVKGVGRDLATTLLDAFGSRYGVQQAATNHWGSLAAVDGISEEMAVEFRDRMEDAEALGPAHRASADAVRRAHRAEINRRVDHDGTGEFTIVDIGQVVAGMAVPALRLKLEPVGSDYDAPSGETPTLTTRIPQDTNAYESLLAHLELPSHAWQFSPEEVSKKFSDRIEDRTMAFYYRSGFVVELDSELYHI